MELAMAEAQKILKSTVGRLNHGNTVRETIAQLYQVLLSIRYSYHMDVEIEKFIQNILFALAPYARLVDYLVRSAVH
jgi:hypothetical protein